MKVKTEDGVENKQDLLIDPTKVQTSTCPGTSLKVFGGWWWVVGGGGGGSKVNLVFCFGPKPKFCSFDLDLDQAEQKFIKM